MRMHFQTSNTMLSLLYLLAKHPDKQQILRQEIREKLPQKDSKLTAETMKSMPYLRACIKESQRIEPIIPGTMRKVEANIVLGGYQVPKGTYVVMPQVVMCMQEKNFKRPTEFIPERFLKNCPYPELKLQHPFAFVPLGFGSRMCIGKRIADLELEILTSKWVKEMNNSNVYYCGKDLIKFSFILQVIEELRGGVGRCSMVLPS